MKRIPLSKRRFLTTCAADTPIRLHTIQTEAAWRAAQERGYLVGDPHHAEPFFLNAYGWMRFQMAERLDAYSGDYPVWAWLKRPNMRQWSYEREPSVMVVAEVPRGRMLLSDFDAWHSVLNHWWISINEEEDERFEAEKMPVEDTWHRVFDIVGGEPGTDRRWNGSKDWLQACVDRIYVREVVRVTPEQGRRHRNWKQPT